MRRAELAVLNFLVLEQEVTALGLLTRLALLIEETTAAQGSQGVDLVGHLERLPFRGILARFHVEKGRASCIGLKFSGLSRHILILLCEVLELVSLLPRNVPIHPVLLFLVPQLGHIDLRKLGGHLQRLFLPLGYLCDSLELRAVESLVCVFRGRGCDVAVVGHAELMRALTQIADPIEVFPHLFRPLRQVEHVHFVHRVECLGRLGQHFLESLLVA